MENDQPDVAMAVEIEKWERAQKRERVFEFAWWTLVGVIVVVTLFRFEPLDALWRSVAMVNGVACFMGLVFVTKEFFRGKRGAIAASPIGSDVYLCRWRLVSRFMISWIVISCAIIGLCAWSAIRNGSPEDIWFLPGALFFLIACNLDRHVWELFWFKRLGKVKPA